MKTKTLLQIIIRYLLHYRVIVISCIYFLGSHCITLIPDRSTCKESRDIVLFFLITNACMYVSLLNTALHTNIIQKTVNLKAGRRWTLINDKPDVSENVYMYNDKFLTQGLNEKKTFYRKYHILDYMTSFRYESVKLSVSFLPSE